MTCGCPVCMTVVSNESLSQTVMNSTVAAALAVVASSKPLFYRDYNPDYCSYCTQYLYWSCHFTSCCYTRNEVTSNTCYNCHKERYSDEPPYDCPELWCMASFTDFRSWYEHYVEEHI